MDSTETIPGLSGEQREPHDTAANPENERGPIEAGEVAEADNGPPEDAAPDEIASDAAESAPRSRRRRHRRRRPPVAPVTEAAASGDAAAGETIAGGTDTPAEAGEASAKPEAAAIADGHGGTEASAEYAGEQGAEGAEPGRPVLRLRNRNRRRRRRPAMPGLLPGHGDPVEGGEGAPPAAAGVRAALAPGQRSFSAPRRQRRFAPLSGEAAGASAAQAAPETVATGAEPAGAPSRPRRRRRRRPADATAPGTATPHRAEDGAAAEAGNSDAGRPRRGGSRQRDSERAEGREGGRGRPAEGRRPSRDRGERRDRGGKGAPLRRVEQKLYSVDSIVDRGFDDVEEESGETRRVHWTIVKRTTADQISRKPVATVYVLQRDGADTEFPTLGTARSAVNKTIVHPEKLTPSKAERAIAKK